MLDTILPPRFGRSVADAIANARFDVMPGQAHTPIWAPGTRPHLTHPNDYLAATTVFLTRHIRLRARDEQPTGFITRSEIP